MTTGIGSRDDEETTTILRIDFGVIRIEKWRQSTCIEKRTYTPTDLITAGVDKILLENKELGERNITTVYGKIDPYSDWHTGADEKLP